MKKVFFSVIIPTYNRRDLLAIAIDSILRQSFPDYEVIIVDDGSTDGSKESIESKFSNNKKISYIGQSNRGVSAARNQGLGRAKGKFIAFLDSDDRFCERKLEVAYSYIQNHPKIKIFHTEEIWYRNGRLLPQKAYHKKPDGVAFLPALKSCCISMSTAVIKKDVFKTIGDFDEDLPACEDYDFWLRATAKFPVMLIPEYLTIKEGGHPGQESKKYPAMDKFRIYAIDKLLKSNNLKIAYRQQAITELVNKCNIYKQGALKRNRLQETAYCQALLKKYD